jgi:cysteine-rich repeat protein
MKSRYSSWQLLLALLCLVGLAPSASASTIINPGGGSNLGNGLRIHLNGDGNQLMQVYRNNANQFYGGLPGSAGLGMYVGSTSYGWVGQGWTTNSSTPFSNISQGGVTGSGTTQDPWTVVSDFNAGSVHIHAVYTYTNPNFFFRETFTVTLPGGQGDVRLFHTGDSFLGGNDVGSGHVSPSPLNGQRPNLVGAYSPSAQIFGGFVGPQPQPDSWVSGHYSSEVYHYLNGGPLPDIINTSSVDNGYGILWDLGSGSGTVTTTTVLFFDNAIPGCAVDSECNSSQFCSLTQLTCVPKLPDGSVIPPDHGTCVSNRGTAIHTCQSNFCNPYANTCAEPLTCGNGVLEAGEGCDDGNGSGGDGCNSNCLIESNRPCNGNSVGKTGKDSCQDNFCNIYNYSQPGQCQPLQAPVFATPAEGAFLNNPSPTISGGSGSTIPGATVKIYEASTLLCTVTAAGNGSWSCTPPSRLTEGTHTLTGTQVVAGVVSPSSTRSFFIDTVRPTPLITGPVPAFWNLRNPDINVVGNDAVPSSGIASYTCSLDGAAFVPCVMSATNVVHLSNLSEGSHTLLVNTTDKAGNSSLSADSVTWVVDTVPPAPPTISSNPDQSTTATPLATPTFSGTAEALALIDVYEGQLVICSTQADSSGAWSCQPSLALTDGTHIIKARATDHAANTTSSTGSVVYRVSSTLPQTPVFTQPAEGSTVLSSTITFIGTSDPGSLLNGPIHLTAQTLPVCDATPNSAGRWTCTSPTGFFVAPQGPQPYLVLATATNNAGSSEGQVRFTVLVTPPSPPVIDTPGDGTQVGTTTVTITGHGDANVSVVVRDNTTHAVLCTTTADAQGNWSCSPAAPIATGTTTSIIATATNPNGSTDSGVTTFTVNTTLPPAPTFTGPAAGTTVTSHLPTLSGTAEPLTTVTVVDSNGTEVCTALVDATGHWTCLPLSPLPSGLVTLTATETNGAGLTSGTAADTFTIDTTPPTLTSPSQNAVVGDSTPTLTGTALPGTSVAVTDSVGAVVCMGTADASGVWTCTPTTALPDGTVTVVVTATDANGNAVTSLNTYTFTIATSGPLTPVITGPANGSSGGSPAEVVGQTTPGSQVSVTIDGEGVCVTTANAQGQFSCPVTTTLADGAHTVQATATDAAGNTSATGTGIFTVVPGVSPSPVITGPEAGSQLQSAPGAVSGQGRPGDTVVVEVDGVLLCTATVNASGIWACPLTAPLSEGAHVISAVETSPGEAPSQPVFSDFVIDTTAPTAPVVVTPANGSTVGQPEVALGTAEPGSTVVVSLDGHVICTDVADANGIWSCPVPGGLVDGTQHTISATATDTAGNTSAPGTSTFTINSSLISSPVILTPAAGDHLDAPPTTLTGTGIPGATVTVGLDSTTVCTAVVDATGHWTCTIAAVALADGTHTLQATQSDASGVSAPTTQTFVIDTGAPSAPAITGPQDGAVLSTSQPVITGTAEAGSTVTVSDGNTVICTAIADAQGHWSCAPSAPLADGSHILTATATDAAGNTSPLSNQVHVTIDNVAPQPPVVTNPANGSTVGPPAVLTGTAEPGSTVTVTEGGTVVCTAVADPSGSWTCVPSVPFTDGPHTLLTTATDAGGNTSAPSTDTFTVDHNIPVTPAITGPSAGSTLPSSPASITGTATAGTTVVVSIDGDPLCTTTVSAQGTWSCPLGTLVLPEGVYEVQAVDLNSSGAASAPASEHFTIDSTPPASPVVTSPANGTTVGPPGSVSGQAEPGSTVTVTLDGQVLCTTVASAGGTWTCPVAGTLGDGAHTVTATATDAAGNTSLAPGTSTFAVSSGLPPAPTITGPANGSETGTVPSTISGTGVPGDTVTVTLDGQTVCVAQIDSNGRWSCVVPAGVAASLGDGTHVVTATDTSPSGVVSAPASSTFGLDTGTPAAPTFTNPTADSTTASPALLTGTAEPGSTVTVTLDGHVVCVVQASASGAWVCPVPGTLGDGPHTATATATDAAGHTSAVTTENFTVNNSLPPTAVILTPAPGSDTNQPITAVTGLASPGATVVVTLDGTTLCTTTADAQGHYSCPVTGTLGDGSHTFTATSSNGSGAHGGTFTSTVTVDTHAPGAPAITGPADGATLTSGQPAITGTAEAGSTVVVRDGSTVVCTAVADAAGHWTCIPTAPLSNGSHTLTATATDVAGNTSVVSNAVHVTVDGQPPQPPVFTNPVSGSTVGQPAALTGTAEPGSTVTVTEGTTVLCTAVTQANGTWSCVPSVPFTDGPHTIKATAVDAGGNASQATTDSFTVDSSIPPSPVITTPAPGTHTNTSPSSVSGTASPGATVTVTLDGAAVCTTTADAQGHWSCAVTSTLGDGSHTFSATVTSNGHTSAPFTSTVVVDTHAPNAPVFSHPSDGSAGGTPTTLTGTAEPGSTVVVSVDGAVVCTTTADASGNWSCMVNGALSLGTHTATATATDASGNTSQTGTAHFTVTTGGTTGGSTGTNVSNGGSGSGSSGVNASNGGSGSGSGSSVTSGVNASNSGSGSGSGSSVTSGVNASNSGSGSGSGSSVTSGVNASNGGSGSGSNTSGSGSGSGSGTNGGQNATNGGVNATSGVNASNGGSGSGSASSGVNASNGTGGTGTNSVTDPGSLQGGGWKLGCSQVDGAGLGQLWLGLLALAGMRRRK